MPEKKINILALENKFYYDELILFNLEKYDVTYNGMDLYNNSDEELLKYEYIINFTFNSPTINFIIYRAKKLKIKTVLISDGIFEWSNSFNNKNFNNVNLYHPIINDYFLAVGENEANYFNFKNTITHKFLPIRMKPKLEKIKKAGTNKFLITTANTAYHNLDEKIKLIELIQKIVQNLESLNLKYSFRIFDSDLIKNLNIKANSNIINIDFEDCLYDFDFIITTPSSISFLAMYHERAVAHMMYRDAPIFINCGWNINNLINLKSTFKNMMKFDENRMDYQKFQVVNYLSTSSFENKNFKTIINPKEKEFTSREKILNDMIMSRYNINMESFFRKLYLRLKKYNSVIKFIKKLK